MKKPLLLGIILTACVVIVTFVFVQAYPLGIVSLWKFDEAGGTTAFDSADANGGTLINGPVWTSGKVGGALSFDGVDDYVSVFDSGSLDCSSAITIEAWIYLENYPSTQSGSILSKRWAYYFVLSPSGKLLAYTYGTVPQTWFSSATSVPLNEWNHVAFTYGGGTIKLYINGELDAGSPRTGNMHITAEWAAIGRVGIIGGAESKYGPRAFDGIIDEVAIYNRALSAEEIAALAGLTCVEPPENLVSWWPGDGDAVDITDGNDGTLKNGAAYAAGKVGQAFSLDGTNDFVEVADANNLDITDELTLDAWIYMTKSGAHQGIVAKYDRSAGQASYLLYVRSTNKPAFCLSSDGSTNCSGLLFGSILLPIDQWIHLAATFKSGVQKLYVNGILDENATIRSTTTSIHSGTSPVTIGDFKQAYPIRNFFGGKIDEVEIFNRALSAAEIQDIYLAGSAGKCKDEPNQLPVAVCKEIELTADESCQSRAITPEDVDGGSYDPDGEDDIAEIWVNNIGPFSVGNHTVSLSIEDKSGEIDTCQAKVTVTDTTPPVPDMTTLPIVTGECSAEIISVPTATDNCTAEPIIGTTTDSLIYTEQGTFTVTWTYDDGNGNTTTQTQTAVVDDVTAPIPNVAELEGVTGECSAEIPSTPTPTATDNCAGTVSGTTNDPLIYTEQGTFTVTWTYNDGNGNIATQTQTVVVDDTTPPEISISVSPDTLRPPNHKMVLINLDIVVSDTCDSDQVPEAVLISITMNEGDVTDTYDPAYDLILGAGHTTDDIQIDDDGNISLRAERSGKGTGRTYIITYEVTDAAGNSTTATAQVTVPHDQKK